MPSTVQIPITTVVDDDLITADLWMDEFENVYNAMTPAGIDDYSSSDAEMQTTTDPYPGAVVSRPTSLQGELERMRYMLAQITGKTYWYQDPDNSLASLIPSTTKMVFFQAAAPTGWTIDTTHNGKALRVVSSAGGGSGGSNDPASTVTLAHTHSVASHTHDLANHTHSTPDHQHILRYSTASTRPVTGAAQVIGYTNDSDGDSALLSVLSGSGAFVATRAYSYPQTTSGGSGTSGAPSSNTSGATSPGTDSQLANLSLAYIDVIVCTKN